MCSNNCGFYANPNQENLCSKCYKDLGKQMQDSSIPSQRSTLNISDVMNRNKQAGEINKSQECNDSNKETIPANLSSSPTKATEVPGIHQPVVEIEPVTPFNTPPCFQPIQNEGNKEQSGPSKDVKTFEIPGVPEKKIRRKCFTCNKKLGLLGFDCRCKKLFCSLHRYSDKHNCDFDYKTHGAEEIRKNNKLIVAQKVANI